MATVASLLTPDPVVQRVPPALGAVPAHAASAALEARTAPALRTFTPRTQRIYDRVRQQMTRTQVTWGDDLDLFADGQMAQQPLLLRRAHALHKVLAEMPIVLEEDDLIVGNSMQDGLILRTRLPRFGTGLEYDRAKAEGASLSAQLSHKTPYYYLIMEKGLTGILADIEAKLAEIVHRPPSPERTEKLNFFQAMQVEVQGILTLAQRYAALAQELAEEAPPVRRDELLEIARICRRVPAAPPQSFHEALQSFWLIHYALFSTGTNLSCGRFDQYLAPFLQRDLAAGAITLERAQELIDCVWLRFNDRGQICRQNFFGEEESGETGDETAEMRPVKRVRVVDQGPQSWSAGHRKRFRYATDAADAINHFGQNILLSGIRPDGGDGTNPLTYLCLNALEKFAFTSPVVTLRLHRASPQELVERAAEVLKVGGGMPYINNDDVLIQAYVDLGVSLADARDYANSNCWETMIEGKSDQELIRGMNFLLFLELALHQGVSHMHGKMGPDTGSPDGFATFADLMTAWKRQADFQLQAGIDYIGGGLAKGTLEHSNHGKYSYNPLLSALTLDCIPKEQDVIRGGARYTIWHVMGEAVSNATDALAAIKKLVYDEGSLTLAELLQALDEDWIGHETLRRRLLARAPKFANDSQYADAIGQEMMDYFNRRTRFHAARYPNVIFPGSVGTFSWYAMIGREVAASADGRHSGEAIAANFSPVPGSDMSGPTAAINSYLKMGVDALAGGAPLDLRLSASSIKGEAGAQRLAGLIRVFVELGGNMLTFTVTDVEELKRAMQDPENYRHLRVRMGGWSAYFVMLGEEQQRLHIQRVEHGVV